MKNKPARQYKAKDLYFTGEYHGTKDPDRVQPVGAHISQKTYQYSPVFRVRKGAV
jgi:hypothetical protein